MFYFIFRWNRQISKWSRGMSYMKYTFTNEYAYSYWCSLSKGTILNSSPNVRWDDVAGCPFSLSHICEHSYTRTHNKSHTILDTNIISQALNMQRTCWRRRWYFRWSSLTCSGERESHGREYFSMGHRGQVRGGLGLDQIFVEGRERRRCVYVSALISLLLRKVLPCKGGGNWGGFEYLHFFSTFSLSILLH